MTFAIQEAYIQSVLTRCVDDLVKTKGQVSRPCEELDKWKAFLERAIESDWPIYWSIGRN